ncbi:MAG: hypothetical protein JST23_05355 [Bacteroidetes bacterium]|nr:hypothetical protein [Bacteroidota bacterium]
MKKTIIIPILFLFNLLSAQTEQQWAQLVGWDGVSYFTKYIIKNAGHMGPNALSVPFLSTGSIDTVSSIGLSGQAHFSKGDNTQNLNVYGNFCLGKNVAVDVAWIPIEHFVTSDAIKRQRHVYYKFYNTTRATGDVIVNTNIGLLNHLREKVQLALRIAVRLPASDYNDLGAARFLDATSYYIDVSMGKPINKNLKWMSMAGLFVWQQENDRLRQDDAFLFGSGFQWNKKGWMIAPSISGYIGYMKKTGDKPIVFRANAEKRIKKMIYLMRFQQGIKNFNYTSFEIGLRRVVNILK